MSGRGGGEGGGDPFGDAPTLTDHAPPRPTPSPRAAPARLPAPSLLADPASSPPGSTTSPGGTTFVDLTPVAVAETDTAEASFQQRYVRKEVLGRGGMGEVALWRDTRIGRDVAIKAVLGGERAAPQALRRFLREARVQGQLEHPAIVPVYDLVEMPGGGPCFSMKRVRGVTLARILEGLRSGDDEIAATYSSRRLLHAFTSVCLAVDYAHRRGVVHRDLKPANVMLGDFGEVYVLDWGLAKLTSDAFADEPSDPAGAAPATTQDGAVLGTLGYMAPEQLDGARDEVGPAADIYALGAILFEILALQPLVPAKDPGEIMLATLKGADARARARAPDRDVPPELEEVCVRATRLDAASRLQSARELHDAVERYLEGDRDLLRRKSLAAAHVEAAKRALADVEAGALPEEAGRAVAMRELGSALALDPGSGSAGRAVLRLLSTPLREPPAAAHDELRRVARHQLVVGARAAATQNLFWLLAIPLAWLIGVHSWEAVLALVGTAVAGTLVMIGVGRRGRVSRWRQIAFVLSYMGTIAALSRWLGPLVLVPTLLAGFAIPMQAHPDRRAGLLVLGVCCATLLVLAGAEWAGLSSTYAFQDGRMWIAPGMIEIDERWTRIVLLFVSLFSIVFPALIVAKLRDELAAAQARHAAYAWQLRQLIPEDPPTGGDPSSPMPPAAPRPAAGAATGAPRA